jgi:hypothetical protein
MPQRRLAVVGPQLGGGDDVFPVGLGVRGNGGLFVEGVHHQRAVDLNGIVFLGFVEHQPPAEAADRRLAGRVEHGLAPHGHDLGRRLRLVLLMERPGRGRREARPAKAKGQEQPGSGYSCACHGVIGLSLSER